MQQYQFRVDMSLTDKLLVSSFLRSQAMKPHFACYKYFVAYEISSQVQKAHWQGWVSFIGSANTYRVACNTFAKANNLRDKQMCFTQCKKDTIYRSYILRNDDKGPVSEYVTNMSESELEVLKAEPDRFKKKKALKLGFKDWLIDSFMVQSFVGKTCDEIMDWLLDLHVEHKAYINEYQVMDRFNLLMSMKFPAYKTDLRDRIVNRSNIGGDVIYAKLPPKEVKVRKGRCSCTLLRKEPVSPEDWDASQAHFIHYGSVQEDEHIRSDEELDVN